jgi:hypothetical protein
VHDVIFTNLIIHGEIIEAWIHLDNTIRGAAKIAQQLDRSGLTLSRGQLLDQRMRTILGIRHVVPPTPSSKRRLEASVKGEVGQLGHTVAYEMHSKNSLDSDYLSGSEALRNSRFYR